MGDWTQNADAALVMYDHKMGRCVGHAMTGVLLIVSQQKNEHVCFKSDFKGTNGVHVEIDLTKQAIERFGALNKIPNNSKVFYYCNYSPCKTCLAEIPKILKLAEAETRGLRFKFLYHISYANDVIADDQTLDNRWATTQEAETAYFQLMTQYSGTYRLTGNTRLLPGPMPNSVIKQQEVKLLRTLMIARTETPRAPRGWVAAELNM